MISRFRLGETVQKLHEAKSAPGTSPEGRASYKLDRLAPGINHDETTATAKNSRLLGPPPPMVCAKPDGATTMR